MAQYAVLGLGEFGMTVARQLAEFDQEVLCVDEDPALVQRAAEFASRAVVASISDREALKELPLQEMDAVVLATGSNLEASVLATLYLKEQGVKRIIAKTPREDHAKVLRALGVEEIVSPEREMGRKLAQRLTTPNYIDYIPLQPGISVRDLKPPASFLGQSIEEINSRKEFGVELVAVRDASRNVVDLLPPPGLVLEGKDVLVVIGRDEDLDRLGKLE